MSESASHDPVQLLQRLLRFDTTNPPGNERACIEYIDALLRDAGVETTMLAKDPARPNLVARLRGIGDPPPLLLYGHADVVTTSHQRWSHPPFAGDVVDGVVWGRGALDMKGGLAMMISAMLRAADSPERPDANVMLAVVSDEEAGGVLGARFLVAEHPEAFAGVRHAIGEFGGFPLRVADRRFYLIQVGEKAPCWMQARVSGPAGHGARPMRGGAMAELGTLLTRLDRARLPVHITPVVRSMIEAMVDRLPRLKRLGLRRLLNPAWTDRILRRLGETGRNLEPLFRNTVNATVVRGGEKPNVIPSEITVGLDGRLLPGFTPDDLINELKAAVGARIRFEVLHHDPCPATLDLELVEPLAALLRAADPDAMAIPYLLPGSTDARFFSRLGIQTYGYLPMNLPAGFNFFETIHAADERIPATAIEFGAGVLLEAIRRYPFAAD